MTKTGWKQEKPTLWLWKQSKQTSTIQPLGKQHSPCYETSSRGQADTNVSAHCMRLAQPGYQVQTDRAKENWRPGSLTDTQENIPQWNRYYDWLLKYFKRTDWKILDIYKRVQPCEEVWMRLPQREPSFSWYQQYSIRKLLFTIATKTNIQK